MARNTASCSRDCHLSVSYVLYNFLLIVVFTLAAPFLPLIWFLVPRYRDGLAQRFAWYGKSLNSGLREPIWIHAASVGEVRAAGALVRALKDRKSTRLNSSHRT